MTLAPFRIDIPDEVLADLRDRLARTRWPDAAPLNIADYGIELEAVQRLCAYWRDEFDWRAAERRLNAFDQVKSTIDGTGMHAIHARSPHADATPLCLIHGWPGSVAEFEYIIGPLTNPTEYGATADDAFHVVCPALPGYGFAGPTTEPGWNTVRSGHAIHALMAELGYERYGLQGGDWGSIVASQIAADHGPSIIGLHLNMIIAGPGDLPDPMGILTDQEQADVAAMGQFQTHEAGYQGIQSTRPQTLAYGLTDSPAGLAGWILEKFRQWTDCDGDPFAAVTMDQLCTNLTIYWVTGTINASTRMYYESIGPGRSAGYPSSSVPTGCAVFPKEIYRAPRAWAAKRYDLRHWTRFDRGGHFAAMERPVELVGDIRAFFATVRA
jgi:pimeloyl-ACP methyl ester carboxylesterase